MKILWVASSATAPTGYSQQTALWLPRIRAAGHEVALFALGGSHGAPYRWRDDIMVLPLGNHPTGSDVLRDHMRFVGADVVITLVDPHVLDSAVYGDAPWCAWTPVDSVPVPWTTARTVRSARWVWAMSKFGEAQLLDAKIESTYVPHAVDSNVFKPGDREAARKVLENATGADLAGKFIVAMNAANVSQPSRKGFYEAFAAFKLFAADHANAVLYVHAEATGAGGGEHLRELASLHRLESGRVLFAPQYPLKCGMLGPDYLAAVYNAADVYLSGSHAEGFGLPSLEAQMCGCPVVVPDNSAQTELCMTGWTATSRSYMPFDGMTWARPDVAELLHGLQFAHVQKRSPDLRRAARNRALAYDADRVFAEFMGPALAKMEKEIRCGRQ